MKTWKYDKNKKQFTIAEQKSLSAYSYKTPLQFLYEKGYKNDDVLSPNDIEQLGLEYIQNQIIIPDKDLLHQLIISHNKIHQLNNVKLTTQSFDSILTDYAYDSGSTKLKFIIEQWLKD